MERLEILCRVLGYSYQEKLEDIGLVPGQEADKDTAEVLAKQVELLEVTITARFKKLQALGVKLKTLWEFHNTPPKEIVKFAEVLICVDAVSASEMSGEKSLSLGAITKVTEEIAYLENRKAIKLKNKYLNKRNKLLKMIQENHQLPAEFNYDPQKKVTSDFPEEVAKLKPIMERVKVQALDRKEIVMRTEVVLESVKQPSCAKTTERLLRALKDRVANEAEFLFDGKDIKVVLNEIQVETKPENAKLPLEKRASSRLRDHQNTKEVTVELPDLPPTPYPSGVRSGHRSQRNLTWGNKPSK
ncbi:hypothetical protein ACQ4PT_024421 [Festuca glaucescens]